MREPARCSAEDLTVILASSVGGFGCGGPRRNGSGPWARLR
jgi:hypothetical protein